MEEFLEIVRSKLNSIGVFLNSLQQTIGLDTALDDSINGKLNKLSLLLENAKIPAYYTEYTTIQNNTFYCTFEPVNGVCLNNEITLYHPDGGTLLWEGILFSGKKGTLEQALSEYDGWSIKIQYFYYININIV